MAYTYNDSSWLTQVTSSTGDTITYQHDLLSNITREDRLNGGSAASSLTMQYDDLGRLTQSLGGAGDLSIYGYNQSDRLKRVKLNGAILADYRYDAFGHRVRRSLPDGTLRHFVFSTSGVLLGEYDGTTGAVIIEYLWFDGRLVAKVDGAGVMTYVQTGHLGQPLALVDELGAVVWRGEMSPFGAYVAISGIDARGYPVATAIRTERPKRPRNVTP